MLNRFFTPHLALLCSAGLMGILSRPAVCRALQVFLGSLQVFLGSIQCSWVLQEHKQTVMLRIPGQGPWECCLGSEWPALPFPESCPGRRSHIKGARNDRDQIIAASPLPPDSCHSQAGIVISRGGVGQQQS